jgi:spore germination protein GerM
VARAKRKGKGGRSDNRKDTRRGIPWGRIITGIIIVAAAAAYIWFNYGTINRQPGDRSRDAYRKPRSSTIRLYFADAQGERLVAEQRSVTDVVSLEERIESAVKELLKGPRGALGRTIPQSVELKGVRMEGDRVAWLNFSPSLVSAHPGGSTAELMTIYSIVNTVALNFSEVQKVGILVDGKSIDTLAGHLDCRDPFAPDKTVIQ